MPPVDAPMSRFWGRAHEVDRYRPKWQEYQGGDWLLGLLLDVGEGDNGNEGPSLERSARVP